MYTFNFYLEKPIIHNENSVCFHPLFASKYCVFIEYFITFILEIKIIYKRAVINFKLLNFVYFNYNFVYF